MGKRRKPKNPKHKEKRNSAEEKTPNFVSRLAGLSGLVFIIAGWQIMAVPHNAEHF